MVRDKSFEKALDKFIETSQSDIYPPQEEAIYNAALALSALLHDKYYSHPLATEKYKEFSEICYKFVYK